jgi:DNA-binding transcriptional ArsR family regulator
MDSLKSFFVQALGDTPSVRIVDFLLENRIYDFTKAEVAAGADVSRATLEKFWPPFEKLGLVKETRRIGNGVLYTLNRESPIVKKLSELDWVLTKAGTEKLLARQPKAALAGAT